MGFDSSDELDTGRVEIEHCPQQKEGAKTAPAQGRDLLPNQHSLLPLPSPLPPLFFARSSSPSLPSLPDMPPKGWRRNLPPPGYVFRQKESAARFEGLAHSGDLPLANAPKRDRVAQLSGSPVKKKPRTEESTPSGSSRKRTSQKRESVSLDRGIGREVEGGGGQQQWNDEEEEEEVEEEQPQEEEEDPEDPVWVGFREDFYESESEAAVEREGEGSSSS